MTKFSVNAKVIKAASLFYAKSDIRFYLCGIRIEKGRIIATNGHYLFLHRLENELDIPEPVTLCIKGNIPAKAKDIEFSIDEKDGIAYCKDLNGQIISVVYVELVGGNYPEVDRVIPNDALVPTDIFGVDTDYLTVINKAAKLLSYGGYNHATVNMRGKERGIVFEIGQAESRAIIVLMPTRI